jgi:hypothetical protein
VAIAALDLRPRLPGCAVANVMASGVVHCGAGSGLLQPEVDRPAPASLFIRANPLRSSKSATLLCLCQCNGRPSACESAFDPAATNPRERFARGAGPSTLGARLREAIGRKVREVELGSGKISFACSLAGRNGVANGTRRARVACVQSLRLQKSVCVSARPTARSSSESGISAAMATAKGRPTPKVTAISIFGSIGRTRIRSRFW